jgi:hypothetical protein
VDHVALGKDGTPAGDLCGAFTRRRDPADLFDVVLEPSGLLIEKRTCPGGAVSVCLVVGDREIAGGGILFEQE